MRQEPELQDYITPGDEQQLTIKTKEKKMIVTRGSLWIGREWEEAIKLSIKTADCGIEPVYKYKYPDRLLDDEKELTDYQIFGWSNGYRRKYKTRIPKKYFSLVKELLAGEDNEPSK